MRRDSNITNIAFYKMLKSFVEINGYVPTIREFGRCIGLGSSATVYYHLYKLEEEGKIKRVGNRKIIFLEEENDK